MISATKYDFPDEFYEKGILMIGGSTHLQYNGTYYQGDLSGITAKNIPFWFQHFYTPGRRISREHAGSVKLTEIVRDYSTNTVGTYWPPERRWVDLGYRGMPFPCADVEAPELEIRRELTLDDVLDYLRTWSSTQRYMRETGVDPCLALRVRLQELWPTPGARKTIIWPIILRCGRVK